MYTYIYIYIERERERYRYVSLSLSLSLSLYIYIYVYTYIYIYTHTHTSCRNISSISSSYQVLVLLVESWRLLKPQGTLASDEPVKALAVADKYNIYCGLVQMKQRTSTNILQLRTNQSAAGEDNSEKVGVGRCQGCSRTTKP